MSVAIASATPTTFTASGGAIAITGTFELAESPFDVFLENVDTLDLVTVGTGLTSGDEVTLAGTVPALSAGTYTLSVFGQSTFDAWATLITVEGIVPGVTGVEPAWLSVAGGQIVVTGTFELGVDYYAELRGDTDVLLDGPVQSTDGTTLTFDLREDQAPEGVFELYVFIVVDETIEQDVPGSVAFTVSGTAVGPAGRGAAELLAQFASFLPHQYCGAEPLAAGQAAAMSLVESAVDDLREQGTIGLATGIWLTLAAHGHGILRATAESDDALRIRMRSVDDEVTRPALLAFVNALLAPDEAEMLEWWEHSYLDVELEGEGGLWLDTERLSGGPHSFLVLVPQRGWLSVGSFLDVNLWLDSTFLGPGAEDSVYASIINAVNRARAAGVFWRLCLT